MKKVLITGANGQLAKELIKTAPADFELRATTREQLDISNEIVATDKVADYAPDIIINAAAYTAVDKAEEFKEDAIAANKNAVKYLARAAPSSCYFLHLSTDFVFDGTKNTPYLVDDVTNPKSVYGKTKLQGEHELFKYKPNFSAVIRTSWVYSSHGKNFVNGMLKFMRERDELNIVVDQIGTPTWARGLAEVCWRACEESVEGIYHWSDAGTASWYDFAESIQRLGFEYGLLQRLTRLNAIPTSGYPLPAPRPAYSVLDKSAILAALPKVQNKHWFHQLREMFKEYKIEE